MNRGVQANTIQEFVAELRANAGKMNLGSHGVGRALDGADLGSFSSRTAMRCNERRYTSWCRESGYHGLGRSRFVDELLRAFPGLRVDQGYGRGDSGKRRKITQVHGIRLSPD